MRLLSARTAARRPTRAATLTVAALAIAACSQAEPGRDAAAPREERAQVATDAVELSAAPAGAPRAMVGAQTVGSIAAAAPPPPSEPPAADEGRGAAGGATSNDAVRQAAAQPFTQPGADAPMIVRTGGATLEVDSLDLGIGRVRQLVQSIPGAYIANLSIEGGRDQVRRATLEVKVPAANFDRLVTGLTPLGKVEAVSVSAQDVSEEFVDLGARAENARRLEARLIDLLARRTGRLQDVLSVERELARVREEIERYDGRLRYLRTRAAISTLAVTVHEPTPILGNRPAENPIAAAVRQSWRNLVGFVAAIVALSGVLIPLGLLGYLAWILTRRFRRPAPAVAAIE